MRISTAGKSEYTRVLPFPKSASFNERSGPHLIGYLRDGSLGLTSTHPNGISIGSVVVCRADACDQQTDRKQFRQLGHPRSLKWCHSIDHIRLPIRLPKQLYAYLMPFRRYNVTKKVWMQSTKSLLPWQQPLGNQKITSDRSSTAKVLPSLQIS